MTSHRLRVEFIRFALLLTITGALISVAVRHNDNDGSRPQAARGHSPSASPSPAGGGSSSAPASQHPSSGATPSSSSTGDNTGGGGHGRDRPGASGGAGDDGNVATLPRTGSTQAAELAGLALLFIGAGYGGIRLSRRPGDQPLVVSAALTQSGHAASSSESNLPSTD